VAVAVVAVVAVGIGLSRNGPGPGPSPALIARGPSPTPRNSSAGPTDAPTSAPVQALLPIDNVPMPGAPNPLVVSRSSTDLVLTTWQPGVGMIRFDSFDGVLSGSDPMESPVLSPDGRAALLLEPGAGPGPNGDAARVVIQGQGVVWETATAIAGIGGIWSADSRQVVVEGASASWHVVLLPLDGAVTARELRIRLPDDAPAAPPGEGIFEPVAFSEDAAWIYGIVATNGEPDARTAFRTRTDGSATELVPRWPLGGPDRPAPFPAWLVDPASGRTTRFVDNTPGARSLEVLEPDSSPAFTIEGNVLGSSWIGDGTLLAAIGDAATLPTEVDLERFDPDGGRATVLRTGPVGGLAYIGSRDGYVGLGILVQEPTTTAQLVLVRLADLEATAIRVVSGADSIVALGWAP
jgi:hypothetical protein